MKLTKEDLDKFVVEMEQNDLAGLSFHKGTVFELLRLARLGLHFEEGNKLPPEIKIEDTQVCIRGDKYEELKKQAELGRWAEDHAIEALQYAAKQDQSVASAYAEEVLAALPK